MITGSVTYKALFKRLQFQPIEKADFEIYPPQTQAIYAKMLSILCHAEIAECKAGAYRLHPKQVKPIVLVEAPKPLPALPELPELPKLPLPERVKVNWRNSGFSSGSYAVVGEKGKFYLIEFELDVKRVTGVAKTICQAA